MARPLHMVVAARGGGALQVVAADALQFSGDAWTWSRQVGVEVLPGPHSAIHKGAMQLSQGLLLMALEEMLEERGHRSLPEEPLVQAQYMRASQ